MDDQKPQNQDDANKPVNIPINEISPPPEEESVGQKINVVSSDSKDETEVSADVVETPPALVEEPVEEVAQSEEQLSPVTAPPDDVSTQSNEEQPDEEQKQPNDFLKKEEQAKTPDSAPAEMGVAASQMNAQKHPHRNNKKLAMVVTILTALILAGTAVFVYLSANKNTDANNNSESTQLDSSMNQVSQEEVKPATTEDVDQTVAEIEESLSALDDNADFNEENLSNETLGL